MTARHCRLPSPDDGLPVHLHLYPPASAVSAPPVLVLHGLKGFARWGHLPELCRRLAARGCFAICPDFSRNGTVDFGDDITRPDLTEANSLRRELREARAVVDAVENDTLDWPEGLKARPARGRPWALFGHSMGCALALELSAALTPPPAGLALWAPPARLALWPEETLEAWRREGRLNARNARTGMDYWMGGDFYAEVAGPARLDPLERARQWQGPLLILHGSEDPVVPVAHGRRLAEAAPRAEFEEVPGADHTLGARHPLERIPEALENALERSSDWLEARVAGRNTT